MQRSEPAHVLRASSAIANETSFVLIGSQAVLLLLDEPPPDLLRSTEIDLYPALNPEKADLIDGAIGALSTFHDTFGYHADGVAPDTAICPDLHDLTVSKCAAAREKDAEYVRVLLRHKLVKLDVLVERIALLDPVKHDLARITQWTQRRAKEAIE